MNRRTEIKRDLHRFRNEKPFYSPDESAPTRGLMKGLRNQNWEYKTRGAPGALGGIGGHWVPPKWKPPAKRNWA